MAEAPRSTARILAAPAALAVLSAFGLASAIFGDGPWDGLSWFALGVPLAVALFFSVKQYRPRRQPQG